MLRASTIIFCAFAPLLVEATEYDCAVEMKFDSENSYTQEYIKKYQHSVKVEDNRNGSFLSRCSFSSSTNKITCDRYKVDKVVFDENVKLEKFYVFSKPIRCSIIF